MTVRPTRCTSHSRQRTARLDSASSQLFLASTTRRRRRLTTNLRSSPSKWRSTVFSLAHNELSQICSFDSLRPCTPDLDGSSHFAEQELEDRAGQDCSPSFSNKVVRATVSAVVRPRGRTRHPLEWGMQLAAQVDELRAGGSKVETIFPNEESLDAFGANMMDPLTRPPAAQAGYDQGRALAEQLKEFWC